MSFVEKSSGGEISLTEIKDLEFHPTGMKGVFTIGSYLVELLASLWNEKDSFNPKRPFGNSGWQYDIYIVLVDEGIVSGTIDEYGDLVVFESRDEIRANKIILDIILMDYV